MTMNFASDSVTLQGLEPFQGVKDRKFQLPSVSLDEISSCLFHFCSSATFSHAVRKVDKKDTFC